MTNDVWFWLFLAMTAVAIAQGVLGVLYDRLVGDALNLAERQQRIIRGFIDGR